MAPAGSDAPGSADASVRSGPARATGSYDPAATPPTTAANGAVANGVMWQDQARAYKSYRPIRVYNPDGG